MSDGEFSACSDIEETGGMQIAPLVHIVNLTVPRGDGSIINLPDNVAFRLESGQKYSADIHYINTTDQTVLINSAFNLGLTPTENIDSWVSSFDLDAGAFALPVGEESTISFDCELEADVSIVTLLAHAHQYGTNYKIEHISADGNSEVIMDIEWVEDYRWNSPTLFFGTGEISMREGDKIRTTCTWDNTSGEVLSFPSEMCTTSGVALGLSGPLFCTGEAVDLEAR